MLHQLLQSRKSQARADTGVQIICSPMTPRSCAMSRWTTGSGAPTVTQERWICFRLGRPDIHTCSDGAKEERRDAQLGMFHSTSIQIAQHAAHRRVGKTSGCVPQVELIGAKSDCRLRRASEPGSSDRHPSSGALVSVVAWSMLLYVA